MNRHLPHLNENTVGESFSKVQGVKIESKKILVKIGIELQNGIHNEN
jgi:hypothetical protein